MREIWIIDDDAEMSGALRLMLQLLDCRVTAFQSVRPAAQSIVTGTQPDLLILDVNLPEVTGLDMLEFLRRRPATRNLPIVVLSSEASDTIIDRALELGADTYLLKPATVDELEKAMATAFYKHLESRASEE